MGCGEQSSLAIRAEKTKEEGMDDQIGKKQTKKTVKGGNQAKDKGRTKRERAPAQYKVIKETMEAVPSVPSPPPNREEEKSYF